MVPLLQLAVLQCLGWGTNLRRKRVPGIVTSVFYRIRVLMYSVLPVRQPNLEPKWSPKVTKMANLYFSLFFLVFATIVNRGTRMFLDALDFQLF